MTTTTSIEHVASALNSLRGALERYKMQGDSRCDVSLMIYGQNGEDGKLLASLYVAVNDDSESFRLKRYLNQWDDESVCVEGQELNADTFYDLLDRAVLWANKLRTPEQARAAELIRSLERARELADALHMESEPLTLIIRAATELSGSLIEDRR